MPSERVFEKRGLVGGTISDSETRASCRWGANVGPRELTGQQITLEDIMRPAISVRHDAPAQEALQVRLDNNVPAVPAVNASGYLVGFVDGGHLLASTLPTSVTIAHNRPSVLEGADA